MDAAQEIWCVADDLDAWPADWVAGDAVARGGSGARVRMLFRPRVLLRPATDRRLAALRRHAGIRISEDEVTEAIILDRRVVILADDLPTGRRSYRVFSRPGVVRVVVSLFELVWHGSADLAEYDLRRAELGHRAARVLELLAAGHQDAAAAGLVESGVKAYRRQAAELMAELGAGSRFQAGVRARELGLV